MVIPGNAYTTQGTSTGASGKLSGPNLRIRLSKDGFLKLHSAFCLEGDGAEQADGPVVADMACWQKTDGGVRYLSHCSLTVQYQNEGQMEHMRATKQD